MSEALLLRPRPGPAKAARASTNQNGCGGSSSTHGRCGYRGSGRIRQSMSSNDPANSSSTELCWQNTTAGRLNDA